MVVVLEYTFFQLCCNIERKFIRFTRFIRSYVNRPAIVLTNHCQSYTAFLLDECCSKLTYHDFLTSYLKQMAFDSGGNIYFGLPYLSQE